MKLCTLRQAPFLYKKRSEVFPVKFKIQQLPSVNWSDSQNSALPTGCAGEAIFKSVSWGKFSFVKPVFVVLQSFSS